MARAVAVVGAVLVLAGAFGSDGAVDSFRGFAAVVVGAIAVARWFGGSCSLSEGATVVGECFCRALVVLL